MSHTDDKSASTFLDGGVNAELKAWDEGLTTLKTESLHRVELAGHEGSPRVGPVDSLIVSDLLSLRWLSELERFELFADPIATLAVFNMHELHSNSLAVSIFICLDKLTQLPLGFSLQNGAALSVHLEAELAIHVGLSEPVAGRVEHFKEVLIRETELFGEARAIFVVLFKFQGINLGKQMTVSHEGSQEHLQAGELVS